MGARPSRWVLSGATVAVGLGFLAVVVHDGSPGWQVLRGLVVVAATALLAGVVWSGGTAGGWAGAAVGLAGILVGGGIGVRHVVMDGASIEAGAGLVALAAGVVLLGGSAWRLLRGARWWQWALAVPVGLVVVALVGLVVVPALVATNVPPTSSGAVTPADHGLDYEDVRLVTDDGVELAAWYIASGNGAAVVVRHGAGSTRADALDQAAVLADAGYGVLVTDARGHGDSNGRAMDFGWYGEADIVAAVSHLGMRPDVEPDRIGVLGLSMGGEEAIGAIGADPRIAAAVAEGATARTDADTGWLSEEYGLRGWFQERLEWAQYRLTDLLTDASRPPALADAVAAAAPRPVLLIAAGDLGDETDAAEHLADAAPGSVTIWTVPGAGHTEGLDVAPDEWRRRVVGFFDEALMSDSRPTTPAERRSGMAGLAAMRSLLVHSPLVGPATWRWVAEELRASGHDIAVPDLRGAAVSGEPLAVVGAARRLKSKASTVVVGHSGAGFFLPSIAAGLGAPVRGLVFVDAGLPPCAVKRRRAPASSHSSASWPATAPCRPGRPGGVRVPWKRSFRTRTAVPRSRRSCPRSRWRSTRRR
jgi:uncharacterized protein